MTKIFISYSHDSEMHREFVRGISDRLRQEGLDCLIDQYINGFPPEGWQCWMENQIEAADFVLLVCTEAYLRRYRGQETDGGCGVTFEGVVISQTLYDHYCLNSKFIPLIPTHGSLDHVPLTLKPYSTYCLPSDYEKLYRVLTGQAEYIAPPLGAIRSMPAANGHMPTVIHSDRLPTVKGGFFGRTAELQLLNDAWGNTTTRIIQFIAPGGTGKTKLLRHWLDHTADIPVLIAWSFYSQGSSEDKQTSATPFFSHIFGVLKSEKTQFNTEEEKGEHLAHLLRQRRCLLVLDGLEPLQHAGRGMRGELKDRAIRQLLKSLAGEHNSLCIITTRLAVHELSDRAHVISYDLQNLAPDDGVSLLKSWEVHGSETELEKAVHEYGCHALALHLLGNALHTYLDGDVRKRDTLSELIDDYDDAGRHAFKVMQAYSRWLAGTPELQLLHLLGLFDHPIETDVLQVLWQAQVPNLTAGIPEKAWKVAIRDLREKHRMLSAHEIRPDLLDCHPLIREYFGGQLQAQQPQVWQQAHGRLYEYYKALPEKLYGKFLPDTLEEMQPLFSAVAHGCKASLHQKTMDEILWHRIRRKDELYIWKKLSAFGDDLIVISNYFATPWDKLAVENLKPASQAKLLLWSGFCLRTLGRLTEAKDAMGLSARMLVKSQDWRNAASVTSNFSELQLILGDIHDACRGAEKSIEYADKSGDNLQSIICRTTQADILHQAGNTDKAVDFFQEAEKLLQQQYHPSGDRPYLYSLWGFRYCDLLLSLNDLENVAHRIQRTLQWNEQHSQDKLSYALDKLLPGLVHLEQQEYQQASKCLNEAVDCLRNDGVKHHIPRALLARATLHRYTRDFARARQDLQEVLDIADGSGMRLFLTDYHLEMARLLVAASGFDFAQPSNSGTTPCLSEVEGNRQSAQMHIAEAERLIKATGYHRRDKELAELQAQLSK
ncbi:MAG: SEFIR domain-containing protein [Thiolinea sp.]